jgi:Transglutaminase-like superfamily
MSRMLQSIAVRDDRPLTPSAKAVLTAEILLAYARARSALRREALPQTVARLRCTTRDGQGRPLSGASYDGPRLGRAVTRTLDRLPLDSRCLMQSLVLLRLLAQRSVDGSLVIAVRPGGEIGLSAHAWIEVDNRPLLAPGTSDYERLITL